MRRSSGHWVAKERCRQAKLNWWLNVTFEAVPSSTADQPRQYMGELSSIFSCSSYVRLQAELAARAASSAATHTIERIVRKRVYGALIGPHTCIRSLGTRVNTPALNSIHCRTEHASTLRCAASIRTRPRHGRRPAEGPGGALCSLCQVQLDSVPSLRQVRQVLCAARHCAIVAVLCRSFHLTLHEHNVARAGATYGYTSSTESKIIGPIADMGSTFYVGRDGTT